MEKFIVWDKYLEVWIDESYPFFINSDGFLCIQKKDKTMMIENNCEVFRSIGKQDINGQEIYVDCSIVEFEYDNFNGYFTDVKGYFYKDNFQYRLKVLWSNIPQGVDSLPMAYQKSNYIKVIDTIQENKLGLIK